MIIISYIHQIGVVLMKLINSHGDTILTADSKNHLLAEILIFFECSEFSIDFETGTAVIAGEDCEVV